LQRLGLSGYEARVYLALLGEHEAPVSRIVRKSGVPQAKIYGTLQSLVTRGYAQEVLGEIRRYRGVAPLLAFAAHESKSLKELKQAREAMSALEQQSPKAPSEDPASLGITLVRGANVGVAFRERLNAAKHEVCVAIKAPLLLAPKREVQQALFKRKVKLRYVVESAVLKSAAAQGMRELAKEFRHTRVLDEVPLRFALFDGREVMLELAEEDGAPMGLVVPNKPFAANMERMFANLWKEAKPL
jgi:sugar-specific transcriptional regulator TrmB